MADAIDTRRVAQLLLLIAVGLTMTFLAASAAGTGNKVVLGAEKFAAPYGKGFGKKTPKTIFNGGDPNGLVTEIHWRGWGRDSATGKGLGNQFKPGGGYYSKHVKVQLEARKLGTCGKHRAYTQLAARFQRRPGGHFGRWLLWSGAKSICKPPY